MRHLLLPLLLVAGACAPVATATPTPSPTTALPSAPVVGIRRSRFLAQRATLDPNVDRRRQLEAAEDRVRKQHQWGALSDRAFLEEHGRLARSLADLGPVAVVLAPSADALKLADHIGEAWRVVTDETRRRFLTEWFSEIRIGSDGLVTVVARDSYRPIVLAAAVATVGCAGFEPATSAM